MLSQDKREKIITAIEAMGQELRDTAKDIYQFHELAFEEVKSSQELADFLQSHGFKISWEQAGLKTAFEAEYGSGKPVIALLGEYDALPGVGHACGHNMIGTISAGAAAAVKQFLSPGSGTIRFIGCPAEEHGSGKILLAQAGSFRDVDAAMLIHPFYLSTGFDISYAIKRYTIEYFGKPAHAASAPENGINALDAVISMFNGIALMRQQITEKSRVHGIILNGGQSFNTIPDYTKAEIGIRALSMEEVLRMEKKFFGIVEGAAKMSGCTFKINELDAQPEVYVNVPMAQALERNFQLVGEKTEARTYAQGLGSTDVGMVTQMVPAIQGYIGITDDTVAAPHSREFAAAADSEYGLKAMIRAAKALAMTTVELFEDKQLWAQAVDYFREKKHDF